MCLMRNTYKIAHLRAHQSNPSENNIVSQSLVSSEALLSVFKHRTIQAF